MTDRITLVKKAYEAMKFSYSPYSGFKVGAALLCENGNIYTGCNVENSAFSPTNCAERTAFFKAVSEGERDFVAIAIVGGKNGEIRDFCYPCGVCRQVMSEFCDEDFEIITTDSKEIKSHTLKELLPESFKI